MQCSVGFGLSFSPSCLHIGRKLPITLHSSIRSVCESQQMYAPSFPPLFLPPSSLPSFSLPLPSPLSPSLFPPSPLPPSPLPPSLFPPSSLPPSPLPPSPLPPSLFPPSSLPPLFLPPSSLPLPSLFPGPYIKVYQLYNGKRQHKWKSAIKRNTLMPIFNEAFRFDISSLDIKSISLEILLMDHNRFSGDEIMGVVRIGENAPEETGQSHWGEVLRSPDHAVSRWHSAWPLTHIYDGGSDRDSITTN